MNIQETAINIHFNPLLPEGWLITMSAVAGALLLLALFKNRTGILWRVITFSAFMLALLNPSLLEEQRKAVSDIAVVVVDESPSQKMGEREERTKQALNHIKQELGIHKNLDMRIVRAPADKKLATETRLFEAVEQTFADVPLQRRAGVIFLTDGQIHDIPQNMDTTQYGPVHALLSGNKNEKDRQLVIVQAPAYGIVGQDITLGYKVEDTNNINERLASVTISQPGKSSRSFIVPVNKEQTLTLPIGHAGQNVFELSVQSVSNEITEANNKAALMINGVRDRLKVLLVSGKPHSGGRSWRDLLTADPGVDLVHFTILRDPNKLDSTPQKELSLIAFPFRELFEIKLYEFDLIIFDRYRRRGVLPLIYLDNIARFVENGGAVLTAAGPAFATPYSLYRSPLAAVLPAQPTGDVLTTAFRPEITEVGERHPVTLGLDTPWRHSLTSEENSELNWGRWFRLIDSDKVSGNVLMSGTSDKPLLVLDRFGEGRVAQLMSDHAWLWARGYEGGGPQAELLRRVAHWLMKEPDLEEEVLKGTVAGNDITITRRTMGTEVDDVTVTHPDGGEQRVELTEIDDGVFEGQVPGETLGLYKLSDGKLSAVVAKGALNPLEYADVRSTPEVLSPVAEATGGGVFWLRKDKSSAPDLPGLRQPTAGRDTVGRDWIGLKRNNQYIVKSLREIPLISVPLALLLIVSSLLWTWFREGQ